jgi:hypothetical protein
MPRAKLTPTPEQRRQVKFLAGVGIQPHDIARYFYVSEKTLLKYYRDEIFRGPLEANARVGKTLFEMSTDGQNPGATIYWSKARCGWHENQRGDVRPAAIPDFVVALEKKAA